MLVEDKIDIGHSIISLKENGIIEILIKESSIISKKECADFLEAYKEILENKKYPLLHIVRDYVTFDKGAREYSASKEGLRYSKAEAYVFNSLAHKILANFYIKINQPSVPTNFFRSKKEAEKWLTKFL